MESLHSGGLGFDEAATPRLPGVQGFSIYGKAQDDRMHLVSVLKASSDKPSQSQKMHALHRAMDDAQREIDRLMARNTQLEHQLEQAWQREADALANAHRDELTGLPNRRLFKDRLTVAMAHADRDSKSVALLLIDLDDFKKINDTLGHSAGDALLVQVAQRLGKCLRAVDTACRYGGDEFVVIFSELGGDEAVEAVIAKLRDCMLAPYRIEEQDLHVSASIGRAIYPQQAQDGHELIDRADADMYKAKAQRKGRLARG